MAECLDWISIDVIHRKGYVGILLLSRCGVEARTITLLSCLPASNSGVSWAIIRVASGPLNLDILLVKSSAYRRLIHYRRANL